MLNIWQLDFCGNQLICGYLGVATVGQIWAHQFGDQNLDCDRISNQRGCSLV
jgi:hypothetical protein